MLGAVYDWLARSDAPLTLAALEDLWLETEPQNRPGTPAIDNFRHGVAAFGIEDFDIAPRPSPRCSTDSTPAAGVLAR